MKKGFLALGLFALFSLLIASCALYRVPKSLDPESKEFLSKVRYIVGKEEHKAFLDLPASERKSFIEKFWKKRDPNPETEVNEFKVEYFRRIEEANFLFKEGTTPGWLGDRGRFYVLIGPPDRRETYPRGVTFYDAPTEIWYYGFFPVAFIDNNWTGNYRLEAASGAQIAEINRTQRQFMPKVSAEKESSDIPLEVKNVKEGQALLQVKLPYKNIWFEAEGKAFITTLELTAEVLDSSGKKVWNIQKIYPLSFTQEEYMKIIRDTYLIEIPVKLEPGSYTLNLNLTNGKDGIQSQKKAKLTL